MSDQLQKHIRDRVAKLHEYATPQQLMNLMHEVNQILDLERLVTWRQRYEEKLGSRRMT